MQINCLILDRDTDGIWRYFELGSRPFVIPPRKGDYVSLSNQQWQMVFEVVAIVFRNPASPDSLYTVEMYLNKRGTFVGGVHEMMVGVANGSPTPNGPSTPTADEWEEMRRDQERIGPDEANENWKC